MIYKLKYLATICSIVFTILSLTGCTNHSTTMTHAPQSIASQIENQSNSTEKTSSTNSTGTMDIYILDVGQGDSILIKVGDEYTMVDTGDVAHRRSTVTTLKKLGVSHIKNVIITHPHEDHIGGVYGISKEIPIDTIYDDGIAVDNNLYKTYRAMIEKKHITHKVLQKGDTVDLGNGARFDVYAPSDSLSYAEAKAQRGKKLGSQSKYLNNHSIAGKLVFGNYSLFLTGDAEQEEESQLVKDYNSKLFSRMLKVSHHGSNHSSIEKFIRSIKPESALISVGLHNDYGHPGNETLERFKKNNVLVYRTDTMGMIHVATDGKQWHITTER